MIRTEDITNLILFDQKTHTNDEKGRIKKIQFEGGLSICYCYDNEGRLSVEHYSTGQVYKYIHSHDNILCIRPDGSTHTIKR